MEKIKIALLGYGDAGKAFAQLVLKKKDQIKKNFNKEILFTAISTKTKGTIIDPMGIDIEKENESLSTTRKFTRDHKISSIEVAKIADYDILFELTPLNIFTGRPAIDHIKEALKRGKHLVSANKGPIAWKLKELRDLAFKNKCHFFYETTVMDGAPIFNLRDYTLKMCEIKGIKGILNSTTNYILEELGKGREYEEVLKEGGKRGFVEADASMDIEGWDSAAKLTALANVLMDANLTPKDVFRKGIEKITPEEIRNALEDGKVIKLMCYTEKKNGKILLHVEPQKIDRTDLYATISGTTSVVSIETDLMGTITVVEHNPEIEQTAYGIFSDLLRVLSS